MGQKIEYRRLRAPREHGQAIIDPPVAEAARLVEANALLVASPAGQASGMGIEQAGRSPYEVDFGGCSLAQLAASGRAELLQRAAAYTRAYRDVDLGDGDARIHAPSPRVLLAGHQPSLFHPGVWFKNFVLDRLARQVGAVAVNLVIDSDTIKTASIRVPSGPIGQVRVETVSFDRPGEEIPHEERPVLDPGMFSTFDERVKGALAGLVADPLVEQLWPLARERMAAGATLGECLSQSRHQLEGRWGLHTLEIPQSQVCQLEAFCWFAAYLLAHLPRVWEVHNDSLAQYRHSHRLRSRTHPVPDLAADDDWLEAPFWLWTSDSPLRRPVFVRQRGGHIVLSDRGQIEIALDAAADGPLDRAAQQLAELPRKGIKLRTRALVTTMFARLLLGDLFLHGIGGAKYDQLTDQLIERLFGLQPPGFMTVSATVQLPIDRPRPPAGSEEEVQRLLRELRFHPERHIDCSRIGSSKHCEEIRSLVGHKARWVQTPKTPENARLRHQAIAEANEALQPWVDAQRQELLARRDSLAAGGRREAVLASREYAFCLYPEASLRNLLLELIAATP